MSSKSHNEPRKVARTLPYILSILETIDTPLALSMYLMYKYNENDQLMQKDISPLSYCEAYHYLCDAQAIALFKKNPAIGTSWDKAAVAKRKYFEAEEKCKQTNIYFEQRQYVGKSNLAGYLYLAKNFIQRILSSEPRLHVPDFGPGASSACRGFDANIVTKLSTVPECTLGARGLIHSLLVTKMPHYGVSCGVISPNFAFSFIERITYVRGNRFTTVPKDSRSDRAICIEPHGNILVQKALGNDIRRRLKNAGWDLNHLQSLHHKLALDGSKDDSFATIDLSSASDTISTAFVKELLPPIWFDVLNSCRSRETDIDGAWFKNEKFSSMGNGFTFELETLLFLSLCFAVQAMHGDKNDIISVYGDDIIVPGSYPRYLVPVLEECGFTLNPSKSFTSGPFRESCGEDYFNGILVRPVFFKEFSQNETEKSYQVLNRIRKIAYRFGLNGFCDKRFYGIWLRELRDVPKHLQCFGPGDFTGTNAVGIGYTTFGLKKNLDYGDSVIIAAKEEVPKIRYSYSRYRISFITRLTRNKVVPHGYNHKLTCALYGVPPEGVSPRGSRFTVVKRHTTIPFWDRWENSWS